MPQVVYDGPSDVFDARNIVGHALKFYPVDGATEVRPRGVRGGEPQEVPEDKLEELLTYPGHRFRLVDRAQPAAVSETTSVSEDAEPVPVVDAETGESVRTTARRTKGGS